MYTTILLFGFFGISMGTGWVAQLLTGRRSGRIEWGQAFWVGLAGMGIAWLVAWLLDRTVGTTFAVAGFVVAIAAAVLIQLVLNARETAVQADEPIATRSDAGGTPGSSSAAEAREQEEAIGPVSRSHARSRRRASARRAAGTARTRTAPPRSGPSRTRGGRRASRGSPMDPAPPPTRASRRAPPRRTPGRRA